MYAVCETEDCGNYLQSVEFSFPDGEVVTVLCGVCSRPVTNITEIKPTPDKELPEWILQMLQTQNSVT